MMDPVLERLKLLESYVQALERLRQKDLADFDTRLAVERALQLAAESCLDAGEMLIARERRRRPETYRDVIRTLVEMHVLPQDFGRRFEDVAGLRNVLIHDYARIDPRRLAAHLDEFRQYAHWIARRLGEAKTG